MRVVEGAVADGGFAVEAGVAGRVLVAHCGGGDGVDAVMALLVVFVMLVMLYGSGYCQ